MTKFVISAAIPWWKRRESSAFIHQFFQPLFFYLCKGGRQGVEDKVFTEEDWAADEGVSPYEKSKKRAEKAAWELVEKLPGYNLLTF